MKARLPQGYGGGGGGNMNDMLRKAQKMQEEAAAKQEELDASEYSASSGGGMVEATVTGKHELVKLTISPDAVDPDDVEMLEDLVKAAVNEANRQADDTAAAEMEKITGAMNIPGFGL